MEKAQQQRLADLLDELQVRRYAGVTKVARLGHYSCMMRRLTAKQWLVVGAGLLAAAVLVDLRPWAWVPWHAVRAVVADHAVLILLGVPGVVLLVRAMVALRRARRALAAPAAVAVSWPWLLSYPGVLTVATTVAALGVLAFVIMLQIAEGSPAADRAKLQIDAIKYGLGIFAAGGAAAALLLGVRRQQHTEHAQAHTELDAAERRVTDLYTKAVEQLGHAQAAVRLGGLYALERVAQNNVRQRQTIIDVLCAYLRMPYTPPPDSADQVNGAALVTDLPLRQAVTASAGDRDPHQELQVRLTAQRIISTHLTMPAGVMPVQFHRLRPDPQQPYWPDIHLDLTGATLIDWTMSGCRVRDARFDMATFSGDAKFGAATFAGDAMFDGATFAGNATFGKAAFTGNATFARVAFTGTVNFDEVEFHLALFDGTTFNGDVSFNGVQFGVTLFGEVTFIGDVSFGDADESNVVSFDETTRVVLRADRADEWPAGWHLVPETDASGKLVHEEFRPGL